MGRTYGGHVVLWESNRRWFFCMPSIILSCTKCVLLLCVPQHINMILAEQHVANSIPARKKLQYSSNTAVDAGPALYTAPVISIRLIQATQRTGDRTLRSWGKAMLTNVYVKQYKYTVQRVFAKKCRQKITFSAEKKRIPLPS